MFKGYKNDKENKSGEKSRFSRVKLFDNVKSFAAEKLNNQTIAIGIILDENVYIAYTENPEKLTLESLHKLDFNGIFLSGWFCVWQYLFSSTEKIFSIISLVFLTLVFLITYCIFYSKRLSCGIISRNAQRI